jgi:ribose transport system substrate-binding protein
MRASTRGARLAAVLTAGALAIAGCGAEEETASQGGGSGGGEAPSAEATEAAQQKVQEQLGGTCTMEQYGGKAVELADATVGFSQSEKEANPFRIAETQSIRDQAKKSGVKQLIVTNANSQLNKQISDVQDLVARGVDALIVAPLNSEGLEPALAAAREKDIPVITVDRKLTGPEHCKDYLTFIGSDFVEQGRRAADALIKATGGKAKVAILLGSSGNNVTEDRNKGFLDRIKEKAPGLEVVAQQTGEFQREKGQSVTEQLIQANPEIDAVYAHNDEMALGALVALRTAGKQPGQDVKVVSVDGTRNAVQAITKGQVNAVIESNPRFGPLAFQTLEQFWAGDEIRENTIISDRAYDETNAEQSLDSAY